MKNNPELQKFWNGLKSGIQHDDKRTRELIVKLISELTKPISHKKKIDAVHKLLNDEWHRNVWHEDIYREWEKLVRKIHGQKGWWIAVEHDWDKNHNTSISCKLPNGEFYK